MDFLYDHRTIFFAAGILLLLASISFHLSKKHTPAILLLVLSGFFFFFYSAVSIPFLNVWDERFHALVAKNLMKHFLMPTLYADELLKLPYRWDRSHIWVHKQPLFLWQAMLCYKLFGVNEIAYRLPGILLSSFTIYATYRVGKLMGNHNVGYYAGILIATSWYLFQLVAGYWTLDQNDLVFVTYASLGIWAMVEFEYSQKKIWLLFISLFAAFAVLTKWIPGLLVYFIWFIYLAFTHKGKIGRYKYLLYSFLLVLVIVLPWQFLIFKWYPAEAKLEYAMNVDHFTTVLDGHDGPFNYHLLLISTIFGSLIPYLIIPGMILFYLKTTNRKLALSIIIATFLVYLFFSLAKTKMPSFTLLVMLPMYISAAFCIGYLIDWASRIINLGPVQYIVLSALVLLGIGYSRLNFDSLKPPGSSFWQGDITYYNRLSHNRAIFRKLNLPPNTVLCNVPGRHYIEAMYYNKVPAYGFIPSETEFDTLLKKGKRAAFFGPNTGTLPAYIANDKGTIILPDSVELCE